ncbi:MAG: 50S ribosomal protein L7/L12 [Bacilli bacterium]|nr:50S ribosomal protein L7/L12 [Bacilli bacterium]
MAKFTKETFIEGLKEMTILEVKELVDAMKEEFGVDPSAVAVAAAPAAGDNAGAAADAPKTVVLKDAGATKIAVIKLIKEATGLGLVEAKALADNGGNIKENVSAEEAEKLKADFEAAGATIELA